MIKLIRTLPTHPTNIHPAESHKKYLVEPHKQKISGMDKTNIIKAGVAKVLSTFSPVSTAKLTVFREK
jgi:hypothetical protein